MTEHNAEHCPHCGEWKNRDRECVCRRPTTETPEGFDSCLDWALAMLNKQLMTAQCSGWVWIRNARHELEGLRRDRRAAYNAGVADGSRHSMRCGYPLTPPTPDMFNKTLADCARHGDESHPGRFGGMPPLPAGDGGA